MDLSTPSRRLLFSLLLLLAPLLVPAPAAAQEDDPLSRPRLFVIPALGLARDASRPSFDTPAVDAWTVGAQVEYATHHAWTPLVAAHRWRFDRSCEESAICGETGWNAEAGATRRLPSTPTVRPYAGAVVGVHYVRRGHFFVQGRAGVDLVPRRSPVAVRVEARLHRPVAQRTEIGDFFLLSTGLRFALPRP